MFQLIYFFCFNLPSSAHPMISGIEKEERKRINSHCAIELSHADPQYIKKIIKACENDVV